MVMPATDLGRRTAFTLVEMLVVVAIIGILMTISMGAYQHARKNAWRTKTRDTARQVVQAWTLYLQENHEFPALPDGGKTVDAAHPTTVANLAKLNDGRTLLELSEAERADGLKDHWGEHFQFLLDSDDGTYDNTVPDPRDESRTLTASVVVWSLAAERNKFRWIVQH